MNLRIPIPRVFVRAWAAFVEWGNVLVWQRGRVEVVRIDILLALSFLFSIALYGALYGWLGAFKGGVAFIVVAALALFVRRS